MTGPRPYRILLLAFTLSGAAACASDSKRDQFYNTDVGAEWTYDGAVATVHDAAVDSTTASQGGGQDGGHDGPDAAAGAGGHDANTDGPDAGVDMADAAAGEPG
jgi:hypothetical protein